MPALSFAIRLYKNGTLGFPNPKPSFEMVQECTILHFYDTAKPIEIQAFPSIFEARKTHL